MLVKFVSSETGELMMFAEMAGTLLHAVGKETGRRGTFTREEMLPAAQLLRAAVARGEAGDSKANDDDDGAEQPVAQQTLAPHLFITVALDAGDDLISLLLAMINEAVEGLEMLSGAIEVIVAGGR